MAVQNELRAVLESIVSKTQTLREAKPNEITFVAEQLESISSDLEELVNMAGRLAGADKSTEGDWRRLYKDIRPLLADLNRIQDNFDSFAQKGL